MVLVKESKMNLSMLVDLYELNMSASYFEFKKDTKAVFDLFIRRMPKNRSYFVAAGLEDAFGEAFWLLSYVSNIFFVPRANVFYCLVSPDRLGRKPVHFIQVTLLHGETG